MNPEFKKFILTAQGSVKSSEIAHAFDDCLERLKAVCPDGREFSLVKTKLQEASFFATRSMASHPDNHGGVG